MSNKGKRKCTAPCGFTAFMTDEEFREHKLVCGDCTIAEHNERGRESGIDSLVTCPKCGQGGFIKLSAHRCSALAMSGEQLAEMKRESSVLTADQAARVDRIKEYHAGTLRAFGDQMGFAYLAGRELLAAKEELPHGQFMKWREAHLPELSNGTTANYMKFADGLNSKFTTVGNFKSSPLQLTNGTLTEEQNQQVREAVKKVADGKTLTELYRDLGVIKEKEKPKHTPPAKLTAEEALEAEKNQARQIAEILKGNAKHFRLGNTNKLLTNKERSDLLSELVETSNFLRASLKTEKKPKSNRRKPGELKAQRAIALQRLQEHQAAQAAAKNS